MRRGKFVKFRGTDGKYYWHLKSGNGEIIAASQGYLSQQARDKGVSAVRRVALLARVVVGVGE